MIIHIYSRGLPHYKSEVIARDFPFLISRDSPLAHRVCPSEDLNVGGCSLQRAAAHHHPHPHHYGGAGLEIGHLHGEAGRPGVGDVEPAGVQPVLHLVLVVDVEQITSEELGEGRRGGDGSGKSLFKVW